MAGESGLMRPLRADSLKPRPSTQAVWEPRRPVETPESVQEIVPEPEPEVIQPEPETEPAAEELVPSEPEPATAEEPEPEPVQEEPEEEIPSLPPFAEATPTFAPVFSYQPEPPLEDAVAPAEPEPLCGPEKTEEEEPFDLDAVIASILAEDDEDDDDSPSEQDALPTELMPEPAAVPLCDAPQPKPKRRRWIFLIAAALVVAAAGYAAKRFGWLN